jgi:hypothetical protein
MNVPSCNGKNIFIRWKMECSIQLGCRLVEWNIHYLYKILLYCDWLVSVQLIPSSIAKFCNNSEKIFNNSTRICNNLIWLVEKHWKIKSTNQLKVTVTLFDVLQQGCAGVLKKTTNEQRLMGPSERWLNISIFWPIFSRYTKNFPHISYFFLECKTFSGH